MYLNEYDIDNAVRNHGNDPGPIGEAVRALDALCKATNRNSDGWPYYSKASNAGARLQELIQRYEKRERYAYQRRGGESEPAEVTAADVAAALRPVKAFRTRRDWKFDLTDAERRVTAAKRDRESADAREARAQALAGKLEPVLT